MKNEIKLRCWNGHGWGNAWVGGTRNPKCVDGYSVCARSKAEAVRLLCKASGMRFTKLEIEKYASECWGNEMAGITPEVGVWVRRVYPEMKIERVI